ncbi:MAG: hypothetical protein NC081_01700 [Roseburia sp.]|nr:hypothetical protein [Roseburia sp.]
MAELVKNAWQGWQGFKGNGKLVALLLLVLFLFWLRGRGRQQERLLIYTGIMAAVCIFPFTAAILMLYQTRFYNYEWIWSAVPMVTVIAYGGVVFLTDYCKNLARKNSQRILILAAALAVTLLCGRLANSQWTIENDRGERQQIEQVLEQLKAPENQEICLWAPQEVLEYARELRGDITLLYGRNMWDRTLNAYSYDAYTQEQEDCYIWMDWVGATGNMRKGQISGMDCVETAVAMGVNRILLPVSLKEKGLKRIEKKLGVKASRLGEYYLLELEGSKGTD